MSLVRYVSEEGYSFMGEIFDINNEDSKISIEALDE